MGWPQKKEKKVRKSDWDDQRLNALEERVRHVETFLADANHYLRLDIAAAQDRIVRLEQAVLELFQRVELEDIGSDGRSLALWEVVKSAMESVSERYPERYMNEYWEVLARANFRHTIIANYQGGDETFFGFGVDVMDGFNQQFQCYDEQSSVLDIGCGAGRVAFGFRGRVKKFVGVDISPTMVEIARSQIPDENFEFVVGNGSDLEFLSSESIDFAYSLIALQHMTKEAMFSYLAEAARVLVSGGKLLFSLPAPDGYPETREKNEDLWHVQVHPREEVISFLDQRGLSLVKLVDSQGNDFNVTVDDYYVFEKG